MRLLGLDVRRRDDREPLARRLGPLLTELGVAHVVDVGANVGQFGNLLRTQAAFAGRIDSYEPAVAAFGGLAAAAAADRNWFAHHAALSDVVGSGSLHLHEDTSLNSLAVTTDAGDELFGRWGVEKRGSEAITLRRLADESLPDLGSTLLKLDTQGHDFAVLDGAGEVLDRCELLVVELSFVPLYATSVSTGEALNRLDGFGFGLVDIFPITRDGSRQLRLVEADGLFARH